MSAWLRCMGSCEVSAQAKFGAVARFSATRPCLVVGANIALALLLAVGFLNIEIVTQGDRLWVNQNSLLKQQQAYISNTYAKTPRISFMALTNNPPSGDVLRRAPVAEMLRLHGEVCALLGSSNIENDCPPLPSNITRDLLTLQGIALPSRLILQGIF